MKYWYVSLFAVGLLIPQLGWAESVTKFESQLLLNRDRTIQVRENIGYDFGAESKRGIYRHIPLQGIKIEDIVSLQNGQAAVQNITYGREVKIRLGEEDVYLTGLQQYQIQYLVRGAIRSLADRNELAWQVTGTGWEVPIEQAIATVVLPGQLQSELEDKVFCYTGGASSTDQNCAVEWLSSDTVQFSSKQILQPGEGLTVVLGFPVGIVEPASWWEKYRDLVFKILAGIIVIVGGISGYWFWTRWARDPKLKTPIVRQYEPPKNISPAAIIRLKNTYSSSVEITATIIWLAQQGYLTITEQSSKTFLQEAVYIFTRTDKNSDSLKLFEQKILEVLFKDKRVTVSTTQLKDEESASTFGPIYSAIYQAEVQQYYVRNPNILWILGSIWVVALSVASVAGFIWSAWLGLALALVTVLFAVLTYVSPQRNKAGTQVLEHILGFEEYIRVAEQHRLEFQEKEYLFFEILPYAVALGLAKVWAKAFEGLVTTNPDWYSSSTGGVFVATDFGRNLETSLAQSLSVAASSGGGSVGAGLGGGGGGSW